MPEPIWPNEDLRRHLSAPGPKRILALDGGGVRGILTVGILQRVEDVLAEQTGRPGFRLCDYFDLIAGTSTGSIIATLLALGKRVAEIRTFYEDMAPKVFARSQAVGARVPKFDASSLETLLKQNLGELTVGARELKTGLLICAKRMDTGSQWAICNDPRAKYYAPPDPKTLPNRDYLLRTMIRASTAAPFYFDPVQITISDHPDFPKEVGMFVDGGVGGDNNPSLQAFKTATLPGYNLNWPVGADNILLLSIGTGWRKPLIDIDRYRRMWNWEKSKEALAGMIQETAQQNIVTLQALSAPRKPKYINSEIGAMEAMRWVKDPLLTFQRCDASMEDKDVLEALGLQGNKARGVKRITNGMLQMDNASKNNMRYLYALGVAAGMPDKDGRTGIDDSDFPAAFRI
ncbi:MAG TPA: patatin-like phospholipase family protein [Hyphomonadaceae bacterium]|nr:patatin-like phospholipase family protein [Hyphomonadaceae bacterium]